MIELMSNIAATDVMGLSKSLYSSKTEERQGPSFEELMGFNNEPAQTETPYDEVVIEINAQNETVRLEENPEAASEVAEKHTLKNEEQVARDASRDSHGEHSEVLDSVKGKKLTRRSRRSMKSGTLLAGLQKGSKKLMTGAEKEPRIGMLQEAMAMQNEPSIKIKVKDLAPAVKKKVAGVLAEVKSKKLDPATAEVLIGRILQEHGFKNTVNNARKEKGKKLGKIESQMMAAQRGNMDSHVKMSGDKADLAVKNPVAEAEKAFTEAKPKAGKVKIKKDIEAKSVDDTISMTKGEAKSTDNSFMNVLKIDDARFDKHGVEKPARQILDENKQKIFNELTKHTRVVLTQNKTQFSTMIRPEELGRIDMKFVMKDGKMTGRMILQSEESANFFRANVEEFKAVFQKANVEMENLDIILAGTRTGSESFGQEHQRQDHTEEDFSLGGINFKTGGRESFEDNTLLVATNYAQGNMSNVNVVI